MSTEREKRDREAAAYDRFFPAWRVEAETNAVAREVRSHGQRGVVVDLGCGTGRILRAVAPSFQRAIGVDFSPASLAVMHGHLPDAERIEADVLSVPLPDGLADVVTCAQVLQHLPDEASRDGLIREARRLLKPGGLLVLTCYGFNLRHRMRGRENLGGGLYWFRHSPRDLRRRLSRQFGVTRSRAIVGLPDLLGSPSLDSLLSYVPGYSLVGRTVIGVGRAAVTTPSTS